MILIVLVLFLAGLCKLLAYLRNHSKKNKSRTRCKYISDKQFQSWKKKISSNCTSFNLDEFSNFLQREYRGCRQIEEYPDDSSEKITRYEFSKKEMGDLKGVFINVVAKSRNLTQIEKETFRKLLNELGVRGLEDRPAYEIRDGKLSIEKHLSEDDFMKKKAGNGGEKKIRQLLEPFKKLDYRVINGIKLRNRGFTVEIDHLVISSQGVFVIETKAYGISENGDDQECKISVDKSGKWIMHRKSKKNGYWFPKEISDPSVQISRQRSFFERMCNDVLLQSIKINYVLVLANSKAQIQNVHHDDFDMISINNLAEYLSLGKCSLSEDKIKFFLFRLDNFRVN